MPFPFNKGLKLVETPDSGGNLTPEQERKFCAWEYTPLPPPKLLPCSWQTAIRDDPKLAEPGPFGTQCRTPARSSTCPLLLLPVQFRKAHTKGGRMLHYSRTDIVNSTNDASARWAVALVTVLLLGRLATRGLPTALAAPGAHRSYTTNFPLSENPL